jgi:membrane-associated phospholipid phosphatase
LCGAQPARIRNPRPPIQKSFLFSLAFAVAPAASTCAQPAPQPAVLYLRGAPLVFTAAEQAEAAAPADSAEARPSRRELGSRAGRILSDSIAPFALASGVFLALDNKHHRGQSRGAVLGLGSTVALTLALKKAVKSERPRGGSGSFPSGHASIAFSLATAVGENHRGARLPLYALATAIAASRVDVRAHRPRDVLAGAAIGYAATKYFMRRARPDSTPALLAPAISEQAAQRVRSGLNFSRGVGFTRAF